MATVASKNVSWGGIDNTPWGLTAKVGPYKSTVQDKLNFFNRKGGPNAGHVDAFYTIRPGVFTETKQPKTMGYYADNSIIDNYDYSIQSNVPGRRGKKASFKDNFNIEAHNARIAIELNNRKEALNAERALALYREEYRNLNMQNMSKFLQNIKTDTRSDVSMLSPSSNYPSSSDNSSPLNPKPNDTFRPEVNNSKTKENFGEAMDFEIPASGYGLLYNANSSGAKRGLLPEPIDNSSNI